MKRLKTFRTTKFKRPTEQVPVPELKELLFEDDEQPVITVRGLTSNQLFQARELLAKNNPMRALVKALTSGAKDTEMFDLFKRSLGATDDACPEVVYRTEMLMKGFVPEPGEESLQYSDCAKIQEKFPEIFLRLTDKIIALTGANSVVDQD